jgi:antiviral helicase SKI2
MRHEEYVLHENIAQLKQLISDQNLQLLPDYEQRVAVLKELKFIDENDSVQLKGRVACEVGHFLSTIKQSPMLILARSTPPMNWF